jgi:hypothetical protein
MGSDQLAHPAALGQERQLPATTATRRRVHSARVRFGSASRCAQIRCRRKVTGIELLLGTVTRKLVAVRSASLGYRSPDSVCRKYLEGMVRTVVLACELTYTPLVGAWHFRSSAPASSAAPNQRPSAALTAWRLHFEVAVLQLR